MSELPIALPPGWREVWHGETEKYYYVSPDNKPQWEHPSPEMLKVQSQQVAIAAPRVWTISATEDSATEDKYYYYVENETRQSQWERPNTEQDWYLVYNEDPRKSYYVNFVTNETTWDYPRSTQVLLPSVQKSISSAENKKEGTMPDTRKEDGLKLLGRIDEFKQLTEVLNAIKSKLEACLSEKDKNGDNSDMDRLNLNKILQSLNKILQSKNRGGIRHITRQDLNDIYNFLNDCVTRYQGKILNKADITNFNKAMEIIKNIVSVEHQLPTNHTSSLSPIKTIDDSSLATWEKDATRIVEKLQEIRKQYKQYKDVVVTEEADANEFKTYEKDIFKAIEDYNETDANDTNVPMSDKKLNPITKLSYIMSKYCGNKIFMQHVSTNAENTFLIWAALKNNIGSIYLLTALLYEQQDINERNSYGCSAFYYACSNCNIEAMKCLMYAGADIMLANNDNSTPLMAIASNPNLKEATEALKYLITLCKPEEITKVDNRKCTVFYHAAFRLNIEAMKCIQLVVEKEFASLIKLPDVEGFTPLMVIASKPNNIEALKYILGICDDSDINTLSNDGYSALYISVVQNNLEASKLLIEKGADKNITINGKTLLNWAIELKEEQKTPNEKNKWEGIIEWLISIDVKQNQIRRIIQTNVTDLKARKEKQRKLNLGYHPDDDDDDDFYGGKKKQISMKKVNKKTIKKTTVNKKPLTKKNVNKKTTTIIRRRSPNKTKKR